MKLSDFELGLGVNLLCESEHIDAGTITAIEHDDGGQLMTIKFKSLILNPGVECEFGLVPGGRLWLLLSEDPFADGKRTFSQNGSIYTFELS
jgi:hypothetical protein